VTTVAAQHSVSVAAVIINDHGQALLIQRRDNQHWEPPGGVLELDETIEDGLRRETREETGLDIEPVALTGVYKNMTRGIVALVFRCKITGGDLHPTDEASTFRWLSESDIRDTLDEAYAVRVLDALHSTWPPAVRQHDGVRLQSPPEADRTNEQAAIRRLVQGRTHLLLDFDGPVCSLYAGNPAPEVDKQLRQRVRSTLNYSLSGDEHDPLRTIQDVGLHVMGIAGAAERILTKLETGAVHTAQPAPGSGDLIAAARATRRTVTIVSLHSADAVQAYVENHRLAKRVSNIIARDADRTLSELNLVQTALRILDADQDECVFVGNSEIDLIASHQAGVPFIGYASQPGQADQLTNAGADATTTNLTDITKALRDTARVI
jgi:ADP-ribose pyrophosphatase YjhB (NUDIX family)/phosphoglycolate phosphatase-like HAD superfamily hydrolase